MNRFNFGDPITKNTILEHKHMSEDKVDYHIHCHDCGKFVKRSEWVPKNHRWEKHALCGTCLSYYDVEPMADNTM